MKLNLGAGPDLRGEYVNVDLRDCGADVIADCRNLPYDSCSVEEILALDLLEHLSEFDYPDALVEWHRVLKPDGRLILRVPNMHRLAVMIITHADESDGFINALIRNVVGGHKWPDVDVHHWNFTPATLAHALNRHGFDIISNDDQLNMTVVARRRP